MDSPNSPSEFLHEILPSRRILSDYDREREREKRSDGGGKKRRERGWKERERERKRVERRHGRQDGYISLVEIRARAKMRETEREGEMETVPISGKPDRNKRESCEMGCGNKVKF